MTSANVSHYIISKIETGEVVLRLRQNWLCKDKITPQLKVIENPHIYHLLVNHPDESEVENFVFSGNLEVFLNTLPTRRIEGEPI